MTRDELITICERMGACHEALDWLRAQTYETAAECWESCERGDWMIWLLTARPGVVPDRTLRLIAVDCARTVQAGADAWFAEHAPQHVGAGVRLLDLIESDPDAAPQTWDAAWYAVDAAWYAVDAAWYAARDAARYASGAAAWDAMDAAKAALGAAAKAAWAAREAAWSGHARRVRARVEWVEVEQGLRQVTP
jgi:hypothetical protein